MVANFLAIFRGQRHGISARYAMDAPSAPMFLSIFKVFQQLSGTYIQESRVQSTELKSYVKLNLNLIKSEPKSCVGGGVFVELCILECLCG